MAKLYYYAQKLKVGLVLVNNVNELKININTLASQVASLKLNR